MNLKIYIIVSLSITSFFAYAQKLPNVQENSLRPPADIKIDGKAIEWNDKFQAYNHAADIFYTICNDDDNLYLIIRVTNPVIINKVVSAGITFTVNISGKKDDKNGESITYPVFDINNRPMVDVKNPPKIGPNSSASDIARADSFMTDNNKRLISKSKYIKVAGIKDMDTLVSVYNREGIKTAGLLDNKMIYTYELSIALKHLGLSVNNTSKFAYEITLNGAAFDAINGVTFTPATLGSRARLTLASGVMDPSNIPVMTSTTNFWGEYTLAKK